MQHAQAESLARSVREWLQAPDASIDYNAAAEKRHIGTGQWFIQGPALKTWLQEDNSFLWLYGFAGCGKSVMCSTVIESVFRRQLSQTDHSVAFFFFTFNDHSKQDASALLTALLVQLAGQIRGIDADLVHMKEAGRGHRPPLLALLDCMRRALSGSRHTYILLDGIDECPEGNLRDGVLATIETIRGWSIPGLHLLATSRDMVDIRDALNPQAEQAVALENDAVREDIQQYVSYCIEHDPKLQRWKEDHQMIKDYLTEHAKGVFRWVECQIEPLRRCPQSQYDLERCLKQLPVGLDATYERMLSNIEEYSRKRARRILALLCLAARDLSVAEIIEAMAVNVDEQERYEPARRLNGPDDLCRICPGLIVIVQSPAKKPTEQDHSPPEDVPFLRVFDDDWESIDLPSPEIVRIAHFSVQEYLLSDRIRQGGAASFAISKSADHAQISKTCLIYLCHQDFLNQSLTRRLTQRYAFARFAARYWFYHFQLVTEEVAQGLQAWCMILLMTTTCVARWIRLYNVDAFPRSTKIYYDEEEITLASTVYYLALLGLDNLLVKVLAERKADINIIGGKYSYALLAASRYGHEEVVRMLVAAGAEIDIRGDSDATALLFASRYGHEKVVQLLIAARADVNVTGCLTVPALFSKSIDVDEKVVHLSISSANSMFRDGHQITKGADCGTALQVASFGGHENIVQMLIAAGAEVNTQDESDKGTALQIASMGGHYKVARKLIVAGADINAQGALKCSALYIASQNGEVGLAKLLLEYGADVEARAFGDHTALFIASFKGHFDMVKLLLDHGANIEPRAHEGHTALHVAAQEGHAKVVELLLNHGADINATTKEHHTALYIASFKGWSDIVTLLLEQGANTKPGAHGDFSALHIAAQKGHVGVVDLLLNHGADIDDTTKSQRQTALHIASSNGYLNMVKLLLDRCADRDLRDVIGNNALHTAASAETSASCDMLMAEGFDIDCVNDYGQTPLHIAIHAKNWNISRFLSSRQADCSHLDCFGRSPSYWSELYGHAPNSWLYSQPPVEPDQIRLQIHLWQNVENFSFRLSTSPIPEEVHWSLLGRCLFILDERENAAVAFEKTIVSIQPLMHSAVCNDCDNNALICGIRHVCRQCFDTDLCEACFDKRDSLADLGNQCRDHDFLAVPRREHSDLTPGTVDSDGTTISQWIESMQNLATKTLGELSRPQSS